MESLKSKLERLFYDALNGGMAISEISFDTTTVHDVGSEPRIIVTNINVESTLVDR